MRRSLAPSQVHQKKNEPPKISSETARTANRKSDDDQLTICRLPLFGFLEIPEVLNKQFKVPSGCVITEEYVVIFYEHLGCMFHLLNLFRSIALRKVKSLGPNRGNFILRPGQLQSFVKPMPFDSSSNEDENEEENLPNVSLPAFEPLVLWTDPEDSTLKIEVISQIG